MIHWLIALSLALSAPVATGKYHGESGGNNGEVTISSTDIWADPAPPPPPVFQPPAPPAHHAPQQAPRPGSGGRSRVEPPKAPRPPAQPAPKPAWTPKPEPKPEAPKPEHEAPKSCPSPKPTKPPASGGSCGCPNAAAPPAAAPGTPSPAATPGVSVTEMATVRITPSVITMWPSSGDVLINLRTPVMTSGNPQIHSVMLRGEQINVRATPIEFTWDFGDGTEFTTTDPGTPFPNASISHQYLTRSPKTRITLTTTWKAEFQHPGTGAWHPVSGTVKTTSHSRWFARKMAQAFLTDEAERLQGR